MYNCSLKFDKRHCVWFDLTLYKVIFMCLELLMYVLFVTDEHECAL